MNLKTTKMINVTQFPMLYSMKQIRTFVEPFTVNLIKKSLPLTTLATIANDAKVYF